MPADDNGFGPDQLALLRARPDLIGSAVEECLRFDGPVGLTPRFLHADAEIGGVRIPKDSQVWAILFAANRDPARFADPDRFDITRADNAHLAFGGGTHFCLGAHLARLDLKVFWRQFAERFEMIELGGPIQRLHASFVGGPKHLPVRYRIRKR